MSKPRKDDEESSLRSYIPKDFKTDKFKRLQARWYKKLVVDGFEDIEKNMIDEDRICMAGIGGISSSKYKAMESHGNAEFWQCMDAYLMHYKPVRRANHSSFIGYDNTLTLRENLRLASLKKLIVKMRIAGLNYTEISDELNRLGKHRTVSYKANYQGSRNRAPNWSATQLSTFFKPVWKEILKFNYEHPMGVWGVDDSMYVDEVLLREPSGFTKHTS